MPMPVEYIDREQTFAKHLFLKFYLEKLAYHILSFKDEFVYVDGFSGPWESKDTDYSDTSFAIAVRKLREVKIGAEKAFKKPKKVRCLFIEKNPKTFLKLQSFVQKEKSIDIQITILNGDFEELIEEILKFVDKSFAFVFVDPKGWTGYAYEKIKPLFQGKGEFLINFMYNYIRRFIEDERDEIKSSFEKLFCKGNWEDELNVLSNSGMPYEQAIVEVYCRKLRNISPALEWKVSYTPISHPEKNRSWFYLIYATTHVKGLQKFHEVEELVLQEYGEVRKEALHRKRTKRSSQAEMFGAEMEHPQSFPLDKVKQRAERDGPDNIIEFLRIKGACRYTEIAFEILQMPLVSDKTLKKWLLKMENKNLVAIDRTTGRSIKDETKISFVAMPTMEKDFK